MTMTIDKFEGRYRFLSNFWPDGPGALEYLYQAAKTDDPQWVAKIMAAPGPKEAKRFGRQAPLRPGWDQHCIPVMYGLLLQKFYVPVMVERLLNTGDHELVEGNWWGDTFWGVCNGKGENHLGLLLMQIRAALRQLEPPQQRLDV